MTDAALFNLTVAAAGQMAPQGGGSKTFLFQDFEMIDFWKHSLADEF